MKKTLIATGAASLALAAMPVVGVFAVPDVVDTVQVTIDKACTFQATQNSQPYAPDATTGNILRTFAKSNVELGQVVELGEGATGGSGGAQNPITIEGVCNTGTTTTADGTWQITAVGDNNATMVGPAGSTAITSTSATKELSNGTLSGWGMKITSSGAESTYTGWNIVPSSATKVAGGNADGSPFTFNPQYRVYVGTEQESGTYTGHVTYTISHIPA